jgi:predicted SnoaL-like aldol condensation-catalyzing enzyme
LNTVPISHVEPRDSAIAYLRDLIARFPVTKWKIVRSAALGGLVFLHVHVATASSDRGVSIAEISRAKSGRIGVPSAAQLASFEVPRKTRN